MEHNYQNITPNSGKKEENIAPKLENSAKTDSEIWVAFKEGDEAAFISIYRQYSKMLFNYGAKFSSDIELVKDCLQDFFIYLRNNRERLGNTNSIRLYLMKAFRRRVIDYVVQFGNEIKKRKIVANFQLEIEISDELKYINAQVQKEHSEKLNEALDNLDNREKEALYYFYYEGLGYKEIAELLGFSHISSARRLIYRAIHNLRNLFSLLAFYILIGF